MKNIGGIILILFLTACAAAGVPATDDPARKLRQARGLLDAGRPLPAERLIREAIDTYSSNKSHDGFGLGVA